MPPPGRARAGRLVSGFFTSSDIDETSSNPSSMVHQHRQEAPWRRPRTGSISETLNEFAAPWRTVSTMPPMPSVKMIGRP